jgi:arylsulfatase A-like enzyme
VHSRAAAAGISTAEKPGLSPAAKNTQPSPSCIYVGRDTSSTMSRAGAAELAQQEEPLNLLFITCDQLRRDAVGAMRLPTLAESRTPAIDALAAEGTLFTQHITNALPCAPARAGLHSGLLPMNHRVVQNSTPLAARHSNWPREYKAMGLDPVLLGHTSTPMDPRVYHPHDPILTQRHAALADFNPLLKSDMHDTSPKAWAAWLEFTHNYTHPGVDELYHGYTPAASEGSPWLGRWSLLLPRSDLFTAILTGVACSCH